MQYENIFGDDFQWNQVSCQHLFRSGGGMHPLHPPHVSAAAHNLPIERRTLYHWAIAAPAKSSSAMPRCQEMLWCAVGALLRNQRYEKRDWASYDYLPWFHAKIFIRFWEEGQYKRKTTGALTFLQSAVDCHLCPLCKELLIEMAETALSGEEGVGTGTHLAPK